MNKYRNRKVNGYDSAKESRRAFELRMLEKKGEISALQEQVKYELIPAQYETVNGKRKCVERAVSYYADFTYVKDGETIVEDTKSPITRTKDYIIKRKLLLYIHGIKITEK